MKAGDIVRVIPYVALARVVVDTEGNGFGSSDDVGFPVRLADSVLTASASVVPEPATYAACFGACALGVVALIRRRRQRA